MSAEILKAIAELKALVTGQPKVSERARVTSCTQGAFDKLPAMVSRAEFMEWTGYTANELKEEVDAERIEVYRPKGNTKARYYKREIARMGGWKM